MSALPPKADIVQHGGNVCFVPKADLCSETSDVHGCNDLLNHLVGGNEQVGRYIKAKRLGSLEIDGRLEPCRSLNW